MTITPFSSFFARNTCLNAFLTFFILFFNKKMAELISKAFLFEGIVQRAGFRSKIRSIAKSHKLRGYVINLQNYDESVLAVCKGKPGEIVGFQKDVNGLISREIEMENERQRLENHLSETIDVLDGILISGDLDEKKARAIPLLEKKKAILRRMKAIDSGKTSYVLKKITPVDPSVYKKEIKEAIVEERDDFVLARDTDELGARLDEGISALTDLKNTASNINYDIIDTDFSILEVKYGSLNSSIEKGFREFPKEFANAFGVVLKEVYGLEPKKKGKD
jgi:acylphosphatase